MEKKLILITLIILTLIPLSYAANDFAYNRLYDGTQPIDGFNYSINVNHSIFTDSWITPSLGLLTDVAEFQFNNVAGTLTIDSSYIDMHWLARDGTNSPSANIDWGGFSLTNVNNLQTNNNGSFGGNVEVAGDMQIFNRLTVGIAINETNTVINPGDIGTIGNIVTGNGSIIAIPKKYGFSAAFYNNGALENVQIFFTASGQYNRSNGSIFCDFLNSPFNQSNKRSIVSTLNSEEFGTDQITLIINTFINSSCVLIDDSIFGTDDVTLISNISYILNDQPVWGVLDNDLVMNGVRMKYETNESLITFGSYLRENTLQDKPGGNVFSDAFTDSNGNINYLFGTQTGLNNSASFIRNSFCVLSTRNLTQEQKSNVTYLHECRNRLIDIGYTSPPDFDSEGVGADFAVENLIFAPKFKQSNDIGTGSFEGSGLFSYSIEDTDAATFSGGSIRNLIPVNYTSGFLPGDPFTIFLELFLGSLGIFSNDQTDLGNWAVVSSPALCDDGQCAMGSGAGVGDVSMTATISTLNVNETQLSFVYSLFNLIGSGNLNVTINNATDSELLFLDTTDNIFLEPELISISEDWSNQTSVNLTFRCNLGSAAKPTRQCYVDTIKMNGTFTANTTANVNSFDAEFCGSPTRGTDGRCTNSIYFAAENNTWFAKPSINGTGGGGSGLSGSGTANSITKFLSPTVIGDSNIIDNGTLITLGTETLMQGNLNLGGNDIFNASNISGETLSIGEGSFSHIVNGVTVKSLVEIHSEGASTPAGLTVHNHGDSNAIGTEMTMLRSRGNHTVPEIVQDGDIIGRITSLPYDGTDYSIGAQIAFVSDGVQGNNDNPTEITFSTTPDGSNSPLARMEIKADGSTNFLDNNAINISYLQSSTFNNTGNATIGEDLIVDGSVGIGTDTPLANLHLSANTNTLQYFTEVSNGATYGFGTDGGFFKIIGVDGGLTFMRMGLDIELNNGGQNINTIIKSMLGEEFRVDAEQNQTIIRNLNVTTNTTIGENLIVDGRVGIGTSSPSGLLEVNGTISGNVGLKVKGTGNNLFTVDDASGNSYLKIDTNNFALIYNDDRQDADTLWRSVGENTMMRLDADKDCLAIDDVFACEDNVKLQVGGTSYFNGSVGIGTSTPSEKLEVSDGNFLLNDTTVGALSAYNITATGTDQYSPNMMLCAYNGDYCGGLYYDGSNNRMLTRGTFALALPHGAPSASGLMFGGTSGQSISSPASNQVVIIGSTNITLSTDTTAMSLDDNEVLIPNRNVTIGDGDDLLQVNGDVNVTGINYVGTALYVGSPPSPLGQGYFYNPSGASNVRIESGDVNGNAGLRLINGEQQFNIQVQGDSSGEDDNRFVFKDVTYQTDPFQITKNTSSGMFKINNSGVWIDGGLNVSGDIVMEFGDLVSEQNPDAVDAIRIKATSSDVDVVLGDSSGYFSVWNTVDDTAVFYVNNDGDTDIAGDFTTIGTGIFGDLVVDTNTLVVDKSNNRLGVGTSLPDSTFHIKANVPGTVGSHPAGQIIIQNPSDSVFSNVVITAYESDGNGDPDQQLWYLGSSSSGSSDITFLNRRNANLKLGTNGITQMTILGNGNVEIGESLNVSGVYYGNGSGLTDLDIGESDLNVNSSIYSNSSTWWAGLNGWVSGWFENVGNELSFNETKLNETIEALDTDTQKNASGYLYNDSTTIYLNETLLNETIEDLDTNTNCSINNSCSNITYVGDAPTGHNTSHEVGGSDLVNHSNLLGYVANEHIDWTSATEDFNTTGVATIGTGVNVTDIGGFAQGTSDTPNTIIADKGSYAGGVSDDGGIIKATNIGSFAHGFADILGAFPGPSSIEATAEGSFSSGSTFGAFSGTSLLSSSASGAFAAGSAVQNSNITASGIGGFAQGSSGSGGAITASGVGSFAQGAVAGNVIRASGFGAFAHGFPDSGNLIASGDGSFSVGDNISSLQTNSLSLGKGFINNISQTFMVGFSSTPALTVGDGYVSINNESASSYPLQVYGNTGGISAWFETNISATGYNTRTQVYDGDALADVHDSDYYKVNGEINHSKFGECSSTYEKPIYELRIFEEDRSNWICSYDDLEFEDDEDMSYIDGVSCAYNNITKNVTRRTLIGYENTTEVNLVCWTAKLEQAISQYKEVAVPLVIDENNSALDTTTIMAENIYTKSKVPQASFDYMSIFKDTSSLTSKETHYSLENINGQDRLNMEDRVLSCEGALSQMSVELCLVGKDVYSWC